MTIIYTCIAFSVVATVAVAIAYHEGRIKGFSQGYDVGREKGRAGATDSLLTTADSYGLVVFGEDRQFRFKTREEIARELKSEAAP